MIAINEDDQITVATYGFNVPCRRFLISANITRDKRLPVVDEFLLRTLKACEHIPISHLRAYFGFSEREIETVLLDLVSRGLVVVEGDNASLHLSADELFRGSSDENPRIMELEPWIERIWFDLVSRNIMTPQRTRSAPNLIEVRPDPLSRDLPEDFARSAFEQNFAEYLRDVRKIPNPDEIGLYSISHVEADRFGFVVIKGSEELTLTDKPEIRPRLLEVDIDSIARFQPLNNAMADAYRRLDSVNPSAAAIADYRRLTGDNSLNEFIDKDGNFLLVDWFLKQQSTENVGVLPIIGASYLDRNLDQFEKLADLNVSSQISSSTRKKVELIWARPSGSGWGATPDLPDAVTFMRRLVRRKFGSDCGLETSLISPRNSIQDSNRRLRRIFQNGFSPTSGLISPAVEVVYLREIAAMVLVRTKLSPNIAVGIGFVFVSPSVLSRIEKLLRLENLDSYENLWKAKRNVGVDADDVLETNTALAID